MQKYPQGTGRILGKRSLVKKYFNYGMWRKAYLIALCIEFLAISKLFGQVEKPKWSNEKVTEETFYSIGTQAYIYSVTPFMMYSVLYQSQQIHYEGYPSGVPFNVWTMMKDIANVQNSRTVMPNVNTLYASSWLDLRQEPIVLEIPEVGSRYYSIGLQDAYMNYFSILGSRTIGEYGGKFIICGPNYTGIIPEGYTRIDSPTPLVWMLMRIAPKFVNEIEIDRCRKLQAQVTLTPLTQVGNPDYNPATYNSKLNLGIPDLSTDPLTFFEISHRYLQINSPQIGEEGLMALFRQIGLSPDQQFNKASLTDAQRQGLLRAIEAGKEMVNSAIAKGDKLYNGWTIQSKEMGKYGYSYLTRAAMTLQSIGAFPWEEAIYVVGYQDQEGNELDGSKKEYLIHFDKDELPQVNQFWSVTLYELPSVMLYDNPIDRYQMGPQLEEMRFNADGSLDIYIQHTPPRDKTKQGNWLPAPSGKFALSIRMYNPKPDMFHLEPGKTPLPGIKSTRSF